MDKKYKEGDRVVLMPSHLDYGQLGRTGTVTGTVKHFVQTHEAHGPKMMVEWDDGTASLIEHDDDVRPVRLHSMHAGTGRQ